MLLCILTSLTLLAQPGLPEAPPPRAKSTPITITLAGGSVITVPDDATFRIKTVNTPDGPRIRLTINEITVDTTHLKVVQLKNLERRKSEMRIAKDGVMDIATEICPASDLLPMGVPNPVKP